MKFLLDTNVVSEIIKIKPDANVADFMREVVQDDLFISVLTIGEIRKGVDKFPDNSAKKHQMKLWLETDLTAFFSGRMLPINKDIANKCGFLLAAIKIPVPAIDSLIAATKASLMPQTMKDAPSFPAHA